MMLSLPQPTCLYLRTKECGVVRTSLRRDGDRLVAVEPMPQAVSVLEAWVECLGQRVPVPLGTCRLHDGDLVSLGTLTLDG